jgi:hypothetical protein
MTRKTLRFDKLTALLGINYVILSLVGFYYWQIIGAMGGVLLAWYVDRCVPRWTADLSAKDLERAIGELMKFGCKGSRLYIQMRHKLFIVFFDRWHDKARIGIQLPLSDWGDLVSEEFLDALHRRCPSMEFRSQWRGKITLCLTPVNGAVGCGEIMKVFMKEEGILYELTRARIDCAKTDILSATRSDRNGI